LLATQLDVSCVLGLVSFDCHLGSPFFSHQRRTLLLLVSVFSFRQQHSLSLLIRSLTRSVCSDVPAGLSHSPPPAARALRIALNFSPQKAGATAKGASGRRPRRPPHCRRGRNAASNHPSQC
jgi:hypothetical protein